MTAITRGILDSVFGERALEIQPRLTTGADAAEREAQGWARRTRYFPGRSVDERAFKVSQRHGQGHLATAGQRLAAGVVAGLEVTVDGRRDAPVLHIAPGVGLCVSGEDVRVPRPLELDALELRLLETDEDDTDAEQEATSLGEILAEDDGGALAFVILLRPVEVHVTERVDPDDPCELDPNDLAFRDELIVDGARVVLRALDSLPTAPERWRNELVYEIFRREAQLAPGEVHPWELDGVPIGVLAFPPEFGEVFVDVHAVARAGGTPAELVRLFDAPGAPCLWQARLEQFIAHIRESDVEALQVSGLAEEFRWLPPVGLLPPGTVEVRGDHGEPDYPLPEAPLFPEDFVVEAVPVELEAIDDYLQAGSFQAPLDTLAQEQIQILVPVPQQFFDPDLLVVEDETPDEFRETIELFLLRLNHRLGRRYEVRVHDSFVSEFLDSRAEHHEIDPDSVEGEVDAFFPVDEVLAEYEDVPPAEELFAHDLTVRLRDMVEALADAVGVPENPERNPLTILLFGIARKMTVQELEAVPALSLATPRALLPAVFLNSRFQGIGLEGFAQGVAERLLEAAERLDIVFARVEAELHQLRSYVSDEGAADHMTSSPVVAAIASRSTTPAPPVQLKAFRSFILERIAQPAVVVDSGPLQFPTRGIATGDRKVQPSVLFGRNLVDRMRTSVAATAAENARRAKISALQSLLYINDRLALSLDGLDFPVLRRDVIPDGVPEGDPITISHIRDEIARFVEDREWQHDEIIPVSGDTGGDSEATFFAQSVNSLEQLIAALRIAEARLTAYEAGLDVMRGQIADLRALRARIRARLDVLQDEIREVRHDIRVARALEREEVSRARRLNVQRRQVIEEHVPFLMFRRPRTVDGVLSPPILQLSPMQPSDVVPECLEAEFEAPEQLRAMVDLVRDVPLRWLKIGPPLVRRINRLASLRQAAEIAWHRARNPEPYDYWPFDGASFESMVGQRLRGLFSAQRTAFRTLRLAAGGWLEGSAYLGYPWHQLVAVVEQNATLNDVLLAPHGRQDVTRELTEELTNIYRVSACLYERFRQVPPVLRLRWVQLVSEEDEEPVALDDLSQLPGWEDVDRIDRRDIQTLVDWLFGRFVEEDDGAIQLIRNLVRVALLLSGHAPVQQVIDAIVVDPRPVQAGGRVNLALDPSRVRVGMHVLLYAGQARTRAVARGVVDDLAAGVAAVRLVTTDGDKAVSPTRAVISEPSQAPRVGMGDGSFVQVGVATSLS